MTITEFIEAAAHNKIIQLVVESIENWINGYPRKIHGYHSAGELFEEEVKQLA